MRRERTTEHPELEGTHCRVLLSIKTPFRGTFPFLLHLAYHILPFSNHQKGRTEQKTHRDKRGESIPPSAVSLGAVGITQSSQLTSRFLHPGPALLSASLLESFNFQ